MQLQAPARPARRGRTAGPVAVLALLILLRCLPAAADPSLRLEIGDLAGTGWQAEGVALDLAVGESGRTAAALTIGTLSLAGAPGRLEDLRVSCDALELGPSRLRCEALRVRPGADAPVFTGAVEFRRDTGRATWDLAARPEAGGSLVIRGGWAEDGWNAGVAAEALALAPWSGLLAAALSDSSGDDSVDSANGGELQGELSLEANAAGTAAALGQAQVSGTLSGLSGADAAGTRAAEGMALSFDGSARPGPDGMAFSVSLDAAAGEFYVEPVYASLAEFPLALSLAGILGPEEIRIEDLRLRQQAVAAGHGRGRLCRAAGGRWNLIAGELELTELTLPGAYRVLMQPFLADTDLADLDTAGTARGRIEVAGGEPVLLRLYLDDVHADDRAGRLAVYGLSGELAWGDAATAIPLRLAWDGGFLYGFSFGGAAPVFTRSAEGIELVNPISIPVLDGALEIDALELGGTGVEDASGAIDARLTPVDMRAVAQALDWPPLSGTLSGEIPRLSYRGGELTFGGDLRAEVFDGTVVLREFNVKEPLQPGARLQAEVDVERLDLRQVTEAFSFGLITGRLDGYVHGLRMVDWRPVAFDARLFTSRRDPGRRRISQRAVDNIASLGGGGGAAALSSGFLRFFDEFAYDRIGLGCRLEQDVCRMSGIEALGQGYLILRGRGLPKITVVGYAREVSWSTMVAQLQAILAAEGPVVD